MVTVSWDREVHVYDEVCSYGHFEQCSSTFTCALSLPLMQREPDTMPLMRRIFRAHFDDILCMSSSRLLSMIVTGSDDGTVRVWDLQVFPGFVELDHPTASVCRILLGSVLHAAL